MTSLTALSPGQTSSLSSMQASFQSAVVQGSKTATPNLSSVQANSSTTSFGSPTSITTTSLVTDSASGPTATPAFIGTSKELPSATIAGITIGLIAGCCALLLAAFFAIRQHRRSSSKLDIKTSPGVNLFAGRAELETSHASHESLDKRELLTTANRHELEA